MNDLLVCLLGPPGPGLFLFPCSLRASSNRMQVRWHCVPGSKNGFVLYVCLLLEKELVPPAKLFSFCLRSLVWSAEKKKNSIWIVNKFSLMVLCCAGDKGGKNARDGTWSGTHFFFFFTSPSHKSSTWMCLLQYCIGLDPLNGSRGQTMVSRVIGGLVHEDSGSMYTNWNGRPDSCHSRTHTRCEPQKP